MKHLSITDRLGMAEARAARLESLIAQQGKLIEAQARQINAILSAMRGTVPQGASLPVPTYRRRMTDIAAAVALANDLTATELKSDAREIRISHPRQDAMRAMHEEGFSLPVIGRFFKRDHTTVLHGVRAAKARGNFS